MPKVKQGKNKRVITPIKVAPKKIAKKGTVDPLKGKQQIRSKEAYDLTMQEIDALMIKGENKLTPKELSRLRSLAMAAENYEDAKDPLSPPGSLPEMIRVRMFQMKLTQRFTASLLGVSDTKFSLIMSGKQKPDVYFIKAIHEKLKVDANELLRAL